MLKKRLKSEYLPWIQKLLKAYNHQDKHCIKHNMSRLIEFWKQCHIPYEIKSYNVTMIAKIPYQEKKKIMQC